MQNWEHLKDIMNLINLTPTQDRGADFSRIRDVFLNQQMKYNRQTIILSHHMFAEINSLYNKYCFNIRGLYKWKKEEEGVIDTVAVQCRQLFQKLTCSSIQDQSQIRFEYFISKIFPQIKLPDQSHVLIYIPSYFDYVRVRNYFSENLPGDYCICHEYLKPSAISKTRAVFFRGIKRIMLYSGRLYFFRRYKIRNVKYLILYGPPEHGYMYIINFFCSYSDLVNMLDTSETLSVTSLCLYTIYDAFQLEQIVGTKRLPKMLTDEQNTFLFC